MHVEYENMKTSGSFEFNFHVKCAMDNNTGKGNVNAPHYELYKIKKMLVC